MNINKKEVLHRLRALTDRPEADDEHWWKGVTACIKIVENMPEVTIKKSEGEFL